MGFFTKTGRIKFVRDENGDVVDVIRTEDEGAGSRVLGKAGRVVRREVVDVGQKLAASGRSLGRSVRPSNEDLKKRNQQLKARLSPALERQKLLLEYEKLRNQRMAARMVQGRPLHQVFMPPMGPPHHMQAPEGYHVELSGSRLPPLPKGYRWVKDKPSHKRRKGR